LLALQETEEVDIVVVATDSVEIENTVLGFGFAKVEIYQRLAENASDTASTESVMLEYISRSNLSHEEIFLLVQLTSPLTQSIHYKEVIEAYRKSSYMSMLSVVRIFRFFWNSDGTSKNYDYKKRPRRQEFNGELMENGAFYINSVGNIVEHENRLCGKIGFYEMPEYTNVELDEPDDWLILEKLMQKHVLSRKSSVEVKLFISDIDGVMTDGGMYYSERGDELKKFNTRDGMAFELLRNKGVATGIITSENTELNSRRAKKLKVDYLMQGKQYGSKLDAALEICKKENVELDEVAYIGDDINCYELLSSVGYAACPVDATKKIKEIPGITILNTKGGEGAVREFAHKLLKMS